MKRVDVILGWCQLTTCCTIHIYMNLNDLVFVAFSFRSGADFHCWLPADSHTQSLCLRFERTWTLCLGITKLPEPRDLEPQLKLSTVLETSGWESDVSSFILCIPTIHFSRNLKCWSENSNSNEIASYTHEMSVFVDISREHTKCGSGAGAFLTFSEHIYTFQRHFQAKTVKTAVKFWRPII